MKASNRITLVTALLALVAGAALVYYVNRGPAELRIGLVMPLSGEMGEEGRSILQAAQMAAEEIRANGAGAPGARINVTIVPADDKGDDAVALQAAEALLKQDVSAVVGHLTSGAAIAAAPAYARAGVPELSATTHPRFTQLGLPTTFRLVANDDVQARALGRYAAGEFKGQAFAVVDDGSVYGKGLADNAAAELQRAGQKLVLRKSYDARSASFPEVADAVEHDHAAVVLTTMELPQATLLMRQLIAAGHKEVAVLGGDSLKTGPVPPEATQMARFLVTTPVTDVREFGAGGRAFLNRYEQKYQHAPADTAHYVYDAVYLLAQAAAAEHSTRPGVLMKALRKLDPAVPVTGYLRFREDGELRYGAISLYTGSKGDWRLVARSTDW